MIPDRARLGYGVGMSDDETRRNDLPVAEHFTQTRLLIRPNHGGWLEINVQVRVDRVVPEIVLF